MEGLSVLSCYGRGVLRCGTCDTHTPSSCVGCVMSGAHGRAMNEQSTANSARKSPDRLVLGPQVWGVGGDETVM